MDQRNHLVTGGVNRAFLLHEQPHVLNVFFSVGQFRDDQFVRKEGVFLISHEKAKSGTSKYNTVATILRKC